MREQSAKVLRAREPASLAVGSLEEVSSRMSKAFDTIVRRAFELFDTRRRTFGRDPDDWPQSESQVVKPVHLELTRQREPRPFAGRFRDSRVTI
jgi:hypothetical protein